MANDETNLGGATDESVAELQKLTEMLLLGWVDSKTGEHRYFKHGGRKERAARYAVAYLLRNPKPLDFYIRNRLAELFDPSSVYALDLKFNFRRLPGARLKHRRIALEMLRLVRARSGARGAVDAAIDAAMKKYGLERRKLQKIWAQYGKPRLS
jgi:hypothetical protein